MELFYEEKQVKKSSIKSIILVSFWYYPGFYHGNNKIKKKNGVSTLMDKNAKVPCAAKYNVD